MLDKYDMQAATGHVGMADFLACAQRCPSTVGASVDAYVTEVLNERGLAVGVAAGGMTMVAQSAQRCPSTVGASVDAYTQSSILRNVNLRNHWWGGARKRINQKGSKPGNE
jgi:hypothetical protein